MGEVYKARDTRLGREVAIKVSAERFSDRFEREARAVAALNHPHICTLHDVGPNYLVMEYIDGAPLRGPLPLEKALPLALQVVSALEEAHRKGVVHRDLKPSNILVTASGVKLLDFGLAKIEPPVAPASEETLTATQAGTVLGTAAYMSPEQASGKPADPRSDIFSFGAVLYELVSGERAFRGETLVSTLAAVLHKEPEPLAWPDVARIVARCLHKSPADRFQTAAELKAALAQVKVEEPSPSIAVLPFANLSSDKENEYFSDGLAEEILNALTQLPGLRVVARASAFAFRGREHAIREIADKLRVDTVLHGSVRRSGNRIRVTAQLIRVNDESQLWSERYDRELRDVFDIQDEIAQAIVEKLKVKLGAKTGQPLVKRYTENLEAHSLYLKGNFHLYRFAPEDMERAREYLEQAVTLEPGYAPAWVQLADYHIARAAHAVAPPQHELPRAREAALRAVAADDTLAEAHAAHGFLEAFDGTRWMEGLRRFEIALRLNPASARTHFWHGIVLHDLGRVEEALAAEARAVGLDPLSPLFHVYYALFQVWFGQPGEALKHARQAIEIDKNSGMGMAVLGEACAAQDRFEEAIAWLEKARQTLQTEYWPSGCLGAAYVGGGRRSDAQRLLAELEKKRSGQYVSTASMAMIAAALGSVDAAFFWMETSIQERDPNLLFEIRSPHFRVLHADARYGQILRHANLLPAA